MSISPKLSQLNYERFQYWNFNHKLSNSKQAILSFSGEVFTGLNAGSFSEEDLQYAQHHLIILSGLYGMLRPMDLIQPYRLEISAKLSVNGNQNLYSYWKGIITDQIKNELDTLQNNTVVNLASNEYFKAIDTKKINANIITPIFKDNKNGEYKIITMYAKKARGLMANFIIQNKIEDTDGIKLFDKNGYYYNDLLSYGNNIIFTRG